MVRIAQLASCLSFLPFIGLSLSIGAAPGVITTIAGTGAVGFAGDGGPATAAWVNNPLGLTVDRRGNVIVAQTDHRIRLIGTNGVISTIAGNGSGGFAGDNGPATLASLSSPWAVAADSSGNIFIADYGNQRVRKVTPFGLIGTVAGGGAGFAGDGGPAVSASFRGPSGVAVDAIGNLYISDRDNHRVRKVDTGGTISTIVGDGTCSSTGDGGLASLARICLPHGLAVDSLGNVFIAETGGHRVRKISPTGVITTVAGNGQFTFSGDGGPATSASLFLPHSVAVDSSGSLYIADRQNFRIRRVSASGMISTIAGYGLNGYSGDGGLAISAALQRPWGVAVNGAGDVFISDTENQRIRRVGNVRVSGDADGDGRSELYWRSSSPGSGLSWWMMNGNSVTGASYFDVDSGWQVAAIGDFNGDGKADLVWRRNDDGATYVWMLDGLLPVGVLDLGAPSTLEWHLVDAADLNGDGKSDLIWRRSDGAIYVWLMDEGSISSQGVIAVLDPVWLIAKSADMDGDGKADLVFRNSASGEIYLWYMDGLSVLNMASVGTVDPTAWELTGVSDFNGDGRSDLLWRGVTGDTWIWLMNGAALVSAASIGNPGMTWNIEAIVDLDGLGRGGILWRNADGSLYFWRINGLFVTGMFPLPSPGLNWDVVSH